MDKCYFADKMSLHYRAALHLQTVKIMQKHLLGLALAVICGIAAAKPYPVHDQLDKGNISKVDMLKVWDDLVVQNGKFDNAEDKERAIAEARTLIAMGENGSDPNFASPETGLSPSETHYFLAGLYWNIHKLGEPGSAEKAEKHFQQLLPLLSGKEKLEAQHEYGKFLASTAQFDRAIPVLKEVLQNNLEEAHKTLALVFATQDKKEEAIKEMKTYLKHFPHDNEAMLALQAIEEGKLNFETHPVK